MRKYKVTTALLVIFAAFLLQVPTAASQGFSWEKLNIQVGTEYNTLTIKEPILKPRTEKRNYDEFRLKPRIEINYRVNLSDRFQLHPFISYANRGNWGFEARTKSLLKPFKTNLPTFSIGGKLYYSVLNFQVAPVIAFNHHLTRFLEPAEGEWLPIYLPGNIKSSSFDAGLSLRYEITKNIYVSADGMYGVTNLYKKPLYSGTIVIPQHTEDKEISMHLFYTSFNLGFSF